jgi:signal transduction histidine kinase
VTRPDGFRLGPGRCRLYGGLGLGLYVTQQILRAMGGSVTAESAPGHGATFTVELPLRESPEK